MFCIQNLIHTNNHKKLCAYCHRLNAEPDLWIYEHKYTVKRRGQWTLEQLSTWTHSYKNAIRPNSNLKRKIKKFSVQNEMEEEKKNGNKYVKSEMNISSWLDGNFITNSNSIVDLYMEALLETTTNKKKTVLNTAIDEKKKIRNKMQSMHLPCGVCLITGNNKWSSKYM